ALDRTDREVRVVIAARSGDIVSVMPVAGAPQIPPRGGVTMGGYERMPPGYIPQSNGAPVVDDDDEPVSYSNPAAPRPPGALPGAPLPRSSSAARPPVPRGGAMQPEDDPSLPPGPNVTSADPDRGGVLPPPPERFP